MFRFPIQHIHFAGTSKLSSHAPTITTETTSSTTAIGIPTNTTTSAHRKSAYIFQLSATDTASAILRLSVTISNRPTYHRTCLVNFILQSVTYDNDYHDISEQRIGSLLIFKYCRHSLADFPRLQQN